MTKSAQHSRDWIPACAGMTERLDSRLRGNDGHSALRPYIGITTTPGQRRENWFWKPIDPPPRFDLLPRLR
jgi:hypothetical protein